VTILLFNLPMLSSSCYSFRPRLRVTQIRGFASSVPSTFGFQVPLEVTEHVIRSIHDLSGMSYGVTIPLTAIVLRSTITLPISLNSQLKLNRRIALRPLFFQWGNLIGMQAMTLQKARTNHRGNQDGLPQFKSTIEKMVSVNL